MTALFVNDKILTSCSTSAMKNVAFKRQKTLHTSARNGHACELHSSTILVSDAHRCGFDRLPDIMPTLEMFQIGKWKWNPLQTQRSPIDMKLFKWSRLSTPANRSLKEQVLTSGQPSPTAAFYNSKVRNTLQNHYILVLTTRKNVIHFGLYSSSAYGKSEIFLPKLPFWSECRTINITI